MNEEITASTTFDVPSMRVAYRWHQRSKKWQRLMKGLLPIIAMFGAYQLLRGSGEDRITGGIMLGMAVFTFVVFFFEQIIIDRSVRSSPAHGTSVKFLCTDEKLSIQSTGIDSSLAWSQVLETKSSPDGTLIYLQRLMFYWLPKTAFASAADYARFLDLITAKTKYSQIA